jgi:hypothetical protein
VQSVEQLLFRLPLLLENNRVPIHWHHTAAMHALGKQCGQSAFAGTRGANQSQQHSAMHGTQPINACHHGIDPVNVFHPGNVQCVRPTTPRRTPFLSFWDLVHYVD